MFVQGHYLVPVVKENADTRTFGGNVRYMDIMDVDQRTHMLYVGDDYTGGVDIFDVSSPDPVYVKTEPTPSGGAGGVIVARNVNKLFFGGSRAGVGVIDIDPASPMYNTLVDMIPTGGSADEIDYDSGDMKVYVAHRNEGFVAAIDAVNNVMVGKIEGLGGILEQPRYNAGDGFVYDVGGADNVIYRIDPKTDTLVATLDTVDPCFPNGLSINPYTNQAVVGCSSRGDSPDTAFYDLKNDQPLGRTDKAGRGNTTIYNAKADRFFFGANGSVGGPAIGIYGGNPVDFIASVPSSGAGSVAFDEANNMIYTPDIQDGRPGLYYIALP